MRHSPATRSLLSGLVLAGLLLTGCAATTHFTRVTKEGVADKPAHTLVVVGVSKDEQVRRDYERAFLAELEKAGLRGVAASDLVPSLEGLSMEDLRQHMQAFSDRGDAVLHVQLMNLLRTAALSPLDQPADLAPPTRRVGGMDLTLNSPYEHNSSGTRPQDSGGTQLTVELEATLYTLPERRLLWTGLSATHEANDTAQVAGSHARALIAELRAGGYLAGGR